MLSLKRTWEKPLWVACAIVTIGNLADVSVLLSRNTGLSAVLRFAAATGATPFAGYFTPAAFTQKSQAPFWELRLLVVIDLWADLSQRHLL